MNGRTHFTQLLTALLLGLAMLAPAQAVERVIHYHNDALGSPIAATDQEGRVVWRKSYAPYGQPIGPGAPNEPGYTGKFEEPDLGVQNFGARWYDPRIGRFLAIDPVGFDPQNPQSFNRYAYANNNPYRYVDPDGNSPISAFVTTAAQQTGIGYGLGVAADAISQYAAFGGVDVGLALTSNAALAGGEAGLLAGALKGVQAASVGSVAKRTEEVLVLGRGPLSRLESLAAKEGGRVSTIDSNVAKEIFKQNYRDIRSADKIIQYMDNIPTTLEESLQIGGQLSRAEAFMINQRQDLLLKTIRKFETPP